MAGIHDAPIVNQKYTVWYYKYGPGKDIYQSGK
jgi:hypothetical protein